MVQCPLTESINTNIIYFFSIIYAYPSLLLMYSNKHKDYDPCIDSIFLLSVSLNLLSSRPFYSCIRQSCYLCCDVIVYGRANCRQHYNALYKIFKWFNAHVWFCCCALVGRFNINLQNIGCNIGRNSIHLSVYLIKSINCRRGYNKMLIKISCLKNLFTK